MPPLRLFTGKDRVAVLLPLALDGPLDYLVPQGAVLGLGDFVEVPLGRRQVVGVVWGEGSGGVAAKKLRTLVRRLDIPALPDPLRRLISWISAYTMTPEGLVLKLATAVPASLESARPGRSSFALVPERPENLKITPTRRKVLEAALTPMPLADLARAAGVAPAVVKGLIDAGALKPCPAVPAALPWPDWRRPGPQLSPDQAKAADALNDAVGNGFSVHLLDGVTGSGKTEVYFEAIARTLSMGRQVLVLLPEISLSAQWLTRFADRFGTPPLEWHSDLGLVRRRANWLAVAEGWGGVVVGARSALFLPFANLGLIVVDEEHDASFKQEEGVIYNARDMAVVRARLSAIPAVLASATPSLESRANAEAGRYRLLKLESRHGRAVLPEIELVDLRRHQTSRRSWLSEPLVEAVEASLAAGEQAMLFLNRRGYAPLTLCRACGHRLQCPNCTAWLVEHRLTGRLECHHCGYRTALPKACPSCDAEDSFTACGPGVERLAEEAAARFPQARLAVMSSDTLTGPQAASKLVESMVNREIDLLVGTQVVAKGHHFPFLTLVGVVDADLGLAGGDLRAAERTFQMLSQVAGRAGRAEHPGRVLLQTYQPGHTVMQALASGDVERFYAEETAERRDAGMPPFGRLAALIVSAPDAYAADSVAEALARTAPRGEGIEILGPAPAPLAILRGRHRRRFLLKTGRGIAPQGVLRAWLDSCPVPSKIHLQIDIDPYAFF
ncbi:MAG: primosomal protein N' [Rhodospirillaceae bacterium]|nr:primosomal protein N' [Rhodospirillaceae bacterium]